MEYAWFPFAPLIQSELNKVKREWNTQFIRKLRHDTVSGIPDEFYFLPQGMGYQDQGINITDTEISGMIQEADLNNDQEFSASAADSESQSYFYYVVQNENMAYPPDNWIEGKNTFLTIKCCKYPWLISKDH